MTNAADVICKLEELRKDIDTLKQQRDDLLEACKRGHNRLLELGQRESMDTLKILKAAIAKCEA